MIILNSSIEYEKRAAYGIMVTGGFIGIILSCIFFLLVDALTVGNTIYVLGPIVVIVALCSLVMVFQGFSVINTIDKPSETTTASIPEQSNEIKSH